MGEEFEQWDSFYREGSYKQMWQYDQPTQELVALVATGMVPRGAALDVGCGAGVETLYLARQGFRAHGVDWSPTAIKIAQRRARKRKVRADFRTASVLDLPFPGRHFTLVTDRGCFHHIEERERPAYVREVARVLRPAGVLLLRGARDGAGDEFVPLRPARLKRLFAGKFHIGPIQEITLIANQGTLPALVTVMRRKSK